MPFLPFLPFQKLLIRREIMPFLPFQKPLRGTVGTEGTHSISLFSSPGGAFRVGASL